MAEEKESGLKWWMRYVVVPIIGGGGIIAILISVYEHPKRGEAVNPSKTPGIAISKSPEQEIVSFYVSTEHQAHEEKEAAVTPGELVHINWNVKNARGKFLIRIESVSDKSDDVIGVSENSGTTWLRAWETSDCAQPRAD